MSQSNKTVPNKMSVGAMCEEHEILDKLISGESPKLAQLNERGFPDLRSAKLRRCQLKTAIQNAAGKAHFDACTYAARRKWGQSARSKSLVWNPSPAADGRLDSFYGHMPKPPASLTAG